VTKAGPQSDELHRVVAACRHYFAVAALFSLAVNLLYLASPIYMMQVYDRVISSASIVTLVMLSIALLLAFAVLAVFDTVRARILTRAGIRLDRLMAARVVAATIDATAGGAPPSQSLRDFDTFRQVVTGPGIHAVFDAPWAPIYIGVIFLLHPLLGAFALTSAVVLLALALVSEWLVRKPLRAANEAAVTNYSFTDMSLRNADTVRAMGMTSDLLHRWAGDRNRLIERQTVASDRSAGMQSLVRFLRLAMQSLILGLGAYLVIERTSAAGAMFAASLLLGRALLPVEQITGSWRSLLSARAAFLRVKALLSAHSPAARSLILPRPAGRLSVDDIICFVPTLTRPVLRNVSFRLMPGEILGVVGPSGAGKSTLARALVGVLRPQQGAVRLDGADVASQSREMLGRALGYLPQDIELFADTVAANIGRFRLESDNAIVQAAKLAGVHETILALPNGYDTAIGDGGVRLPGGVRQRIALARAVLDRPSLVVLDEPSSNLDGDGERALVACMRQLKLQGTTLIVISHRPATLSVADKILVLRNGTVEALGERSEMMARLMRPVAEPPDRRPVRRRQQASAGQAS
jgi:ATP-binding cassette subfamily C protein